MNLPIPLDAENIAERIFDNAKKLIEYKYWDGIQEYAPIFDRRHNVKVFCCINFTNFNIPKP